MKRGFTLVELLVVIAIIIILASIIVTNLTATKSKSRDAKRVSDMGQIQLALEFYFDRCKQYPTNLSTGTANGCPVDQNGNQINLGTYIAVVPRQPSQAIYDYGVNNAGLPTDYVLHVTFENNNDAQKDSLQGTVYSYTCYDGATNPSNPNKQYCIGPK